MGVIYKLRSDVKDFILEQKRTSPELSCRSLTGLVENKFQIKVSKSSINAIIKNAGLSMPVGRRLKKKRRKRQVPVMLIEFKPELPLETKAEVKAEVPAEPVVEQPVATPVVEEVTLGVESSAETQTSGAILLKAADYLIGGSYCITETIKNRLNKEGKDLLAKTESLIYLPLLELGKEKQQKDLAKLWGLIGSNVPLEEILLYLNEIQSVKTISLDILRIISNNLQEVTCIKVTLLDGTVYYIDGQMHTIWSTPHIPTTLSSTIYNTKGYINKYFYEDKPFTLFTAPGYDTPTKEFFNFILSLDTQEKKISRLTLYGNKLEELENLPLERAKRRFFVLGIWAWQFVEYRKVNKIGEFKPFFFAALNKDFYVADIEIELTQPNIEQRVTLKGCALKTSLTEKTRLLILSNLPADLAKPEELAKIYLSHWPNLEEGFQDFSSKIELFTYTGSSQRFFSTEGLDFDRSKEHDITKLFNYYLKVLDLYVRWHFLPLGFEDKDFPTINERFYSLEVNLKRQKDYYLATFQPPSAYPFLNELNYTCRRVNEQAIINPEGKRVWLVPG